MSPATETLPSFTAPARAPNRTGDDSASVLAHVGIVVVGHVDHGKSTLIGRLLFDTESVAEGKAESIRKACEAEGMPFEYAFLMDALLEEQEQNVTIDTTRIPFRTARRDYAIIDAPGHSEFIKNMVTGAASATAALVLIDAQEGVKEQSRRHAMLLSLLGVEHIIVLVNKLDLVGYAESGFQEIVAEYSGFLTQLGLSARHFLPISAKHGVNIARRDSACAWWTGPTLLEAIDQLPDPVVLVDQPLRLVVQDVYRFDDRRIIAGRVEAGTLSVGQLLAFTPGGRQARVKSIEVWSGPRASCAGAGESVGITLAEQIFVERGAIASGEDDSPFEGQQFNARVFWMAQQPLLPGKAYRIRLATQDVAVEIASIERVIDAATLRESPGAARVDCHEVAELTISARRPVAFDEVRRIPASGRFVIVDGNRVAGGGIIRAGNYFRRVPGGPATTDNLFWADGKVTPAERIARSGHPGCVIWLTGLSGAGKSTIAIELERQLFRAGRHVYFLDGDNLRHGLCAGLGFSAEDRAENIRRAAAIAQILADAGIICVAAFISPMRADRERARCMVPSGRFIEVHVATPLAVCRERDPKGLYARADRGEIREFTGISAPYEAPLHPEVVVQAEAESVAESVTAILTYLARLKD